jgi:hypothetical protein
VLFCGSLSAPDGAERTLVELGRRPRRLAGGLLLVFLNGVASGCYVNTPVVAVPTPGTQLDLELNDRGRVGLGESVGPAATTVEGVLQSQTDSAYMIRVASVGYVNGQSNKWNGEPLTIQKEFVKDVSERRFSRGRSLLAAAVATAGVVAFAVTRNLLAGGNADRDKGGGGGDGQ